ncbi:murein biosynthesis integral membrane protein MurJ [Corynebacterium sp. P7202]|uniref:Murein biosynthesis integral membrane protein MurJ n=1 Tax=Corynebacterium pygosceleis TaxID=2800406 RepID=A0A9Q4GIN4_9CORY|nr:murein biosynthesis integral membrane protein MurJ [Corynebacterium pygosceleis]MCK7637201.1 murein biosynthesis integral membrane protein MurJ [Corynebacterium pygosceleis]MCX7468471.1 murein biosynthesis integral membrane protein MurJ [Corynebacterium pygosceleis]
MNSADPDQSDRDVPGGGSGHGAPRGQRERIIPPSPPAPVPVSRPVTSTRQPVVDLSRLTLAPAAVNSGMDIGRPLVDTRTVTDRHPDADAVSRPERRATDSEVVRSTGSMAVATLISRITGFLRNAAIGATMGTAVGSAFNTANTLPNLITEIVLGAVLTSLVVPVLVRAEKEDPDNGAAFIRRLFTLSVTLLTVVTVISVGTAGLLATLTLGRDGEVNLSQASAFAYLLLPQIFFYGIFSLFMAILNTKGVFKPGAWAPVANNVVVLVVLALYWMLPGGLAPDEQVSLTDPHVLLLGLGTTLGVVIQAMIMVKPLRDAGIDLRPLWGIDDRLKQFGGMAMAIIVYVAISQAGYIVVTRIASASSDSAPLIYQQAWLLLQVPYGIIGVTLLTAIMPRLSRNAADGDDAAVVNDLTLATKLTFVAMIPVIVFFTAFGTQIANALFAYGLFSRDSANILGWTLSFSAFTLLPYALVLLHLRVFYAREQAWTPTFIIAGITGTKVLLSLLAPLVATSPSRVVILLGAANGFGFAAGAVIGAFLLRRKLGSLNGLSILRSSMWALGSSAVGALVALALDTALVHLAAALFDALGSIGFFLRCGVAGVIFLITTGLVLSRSGLPEVRSMGGLLGRVPVLRRFITASARNGEGVDKATPEEISSQIITVEPFNASPVPPPMSAGVVRGPRLVPGAPVSDGRFRLLADHGSVPGARFWQAREIATGREVALVFVDTTGQVPAAPVSPVESAATAREIARRTRLLGRLGATGIARGISVSSYRSGCLVVADWVPGSSLVTVAEGEVEPRAAALAVSYLADAAAAAHAENQPLGLEHRSRIRIDTSGRAILAFPAVLPDATVEEDLDSIGAGLALLVGEDGPGAITELSGEARIAGRSGASDAGQPTAADLAVRLREVGLSDDEESTPRVMVEDERTPKPASTPGFGSAEYSGRMIAAIAALSVTLVVVIAVAALYLASVFGGGRAESPVNSDSIASAPSVARTPDKPGAVTEIPLASAVEWEPGEVAPGTEDNPELAPLAIDGDPSTGWRTDRYLQQFAAPPAALKTGVGLLVDLAEPARITEVTVTAERPGTGIRIYGVPDGPLVSFDRAVELGETHLSGGRGTVTTEVPSTDGPVFTRILVWVWELPMPDAADISGISVQGTPVQSTRINDPGQGR